LEKKNEDLGGDERVEDSGGKKAKGPEWCYRPTSKREYLKEITEGGRFQHCLKPGKGAKAEQREERAAPETEAAWGTGRYSHFPTEEEREYWASLRVM